MKPRKLSKTLLAAVLMLSLLVSVFPGFGIASVADATTWDHSYEVVQNTGSTDGYIDQTNMKNDFQVYKFTYTGDQNPHAYRDGSLTPVAGYPKAMSADDFRNTVTTGNDNGYLNFGQTANTWMLTNVNEEAKVDDDFELEIDMVHTRAARVGFRSIVISPEKGKFNIYSADTATDPVNGLAITLTDNSATNHRVGIAGAIDTSSVKYGGGVSSGNHSGSMGVLTTAGASNRVIGRFENGGLSVPATKSIYTVHVQVKDGVVKVWDTRKPEAYVQVNLTSAFTGGYVSFAGHNAVNGSGATFNDINGASLAGMKWKDTLSSAEEIQAQKDFPNVITQSTSGDYLKLTDDMEKYYDVYRWAFSCDSTVANSGNNIIGDPVLVTEAAGYDYTYPLALADAALSNDYDDNYDLGYLSFGRKASSSSDQIDGRRQSDLEWKTASANYLNSFTHERVLGADEDFYLEISALLLTGNAANAQGFMIAPKGEFALQTGTDKGVYVQFDDTHKLRLGGTLGTRVAVENNGTQEDKDTIASWLHLADKTYRTNNVAGTVDMDLTAKMNNSADKAAGVQTFCVLVKDGVLSLWDKDNAAFVTRVELSDDYQGGVISYVASGFHNGAFVGMELTTDETKFPGYDASSATYSVAFDKAAKNYNLDETQVAATDALVDLYGTGVKQNSVDGNTAGTNGAYDGGWVDASLVGAYMELKGATGVADKTNFGALVPKMTSKGGNVVSLFGSDFVADTSFRALGAVSGNNAGAKAVFGFRMAQAGNLYADGVYIEYDRTATLEGNNELQPVTVNLYEIKGGVAGAKTQLASFTTSRNYAHFPKLHVEVTGTALTGYLQLGYEKYDLAATLTYDAAGYLATGVIGYQTYVGGMDVDLTETADFAAAANVGDGTLTVNRADTDRAGYYKFIITATPDADAALKAGTLIAEDAEGKMVPKRVGFQSEETQGTQYVVYSKSNVTVAATFYKVTAGNENIAKIGTSVNTAAEGDEGYVGGGLRFVYHADIHQNAENSPYYMTVDGVEKEVADFGAIVALKSTADALNGGLCYENKDAAYVQYRSVLDSGVYYDLCDSYAQFAIQVTNISLLNVENEEITACGYILFADGTAVSTDAFTTSYAAQK